MTGLLRCHAFCLPYQLDAMGQVDRQSVTTDAAPVSTGHTPSNTKSMAVTTRKTPGTAGALISAKWPAGAPIDPGDVAGVLSDSKGTTIAQSTSTGTADVPSVSLCVADAPSNTMGAASAPSDTTGAADAPSTTKSAATALTESSGQTLACAPGNLSGNQPQPGASSPAAAMPRPIWTIAPGLLRPVWTRELRLCRNHVCGTVHKCLCIRNSFLYTEAFTLSLEHGSYKCAASGSRCFVISPASCCRTSSARNVQRRTHDVPPVLAFVWKPYHKTCALRFR